MGRRGYILLGIAVVAFAALVTWLSMPGPPLAPTLPEIGPGARPIGGKARIRSPDADRATRD